jgi:hypothetical protein
VAETSSAAASPPVPENLRSNNVLRWLGVFGPGAIIASLTIGTGELIFSSRGGALFGYRILFLFVLISVLKWGLVFGMARQMVLTGVHPYRRMLELPGPRGWFLLSLFLAVSVAMPIWVGFHSGVLGNFTSWITGTRERFHGAVDYVWGAGILTCVLVLSLSGGYSVLERIQMAIVGALVFCAAVTLIIYRPDWLEMLRGAFIPQSLTYPDWVRQSPNQDIRAIASYPEWVETTRYVGVIGGASFDYMAYTTWLRAKSWGQSANEADAAQLAAIAGDPRHPVRTWLRAPLVDCTISFLVVIAFSAVFVASGVVVLGPNHELPTENSLLELQSKFVTAVHPWLLPIYVAGAFLTMLGTLYGTIEVACAILSEMTRAVCSDTARRHARRLKTVAILWSAVGAYGVLAWSFAYTTRGGGDKPRMLLAVLTPANLFTGVLSTGLVCFLVVWIDRRFLPKALRMPGPLTALNVIAGVILLLLGLKGYWDNHNPERHWSASRWFAIGAMLGVLAVSLLLAAALQKKEKKRTEGT